MVQSNRVTEQQNLLVGLDLVLVEGELVLVVLVEGEGHKV